VERSVKVLGQQLADAVELEADGEAEGLGGEAIGTENGGGSDSAGSLHKGPS
jgi:hypothetical protein